MDDAFEDRLRLVSKLSSLASKTIAGDSSTRKAIEDVTAFVVERSGRDDGGESLVRLLLEELDSKESAQERLLLFMMFDSVCRRLKQFAPLFAKELPRLMPLLCADGRDGANAVAMLVKLAPAWGRAGLLSPEQLAAVENELRAHPLYEERPEKTIPLPPNRREILLAVEKTRMQHKSAREDFSRRPADDTLDAECAEWWGLAQARAAPRPRVVEDSGYAPAPAMPPAAGTRRRRVFVWDLDETLIIFQSLLRPHGTGPVPDAGTGAPVFAKADEMERALFRLLETHFFWRDLEGVVVPSLELALRSDDGAPLQTYNFETDRIDVKSASAAEVRKVAYRFRRVRDLYNDPRWVARVLASSELSGWREIYDAIDKHSQQWLSFTRSLLDSTRVADDNAVNLIVTSSSLLAALAKCVLYGLWGHFGAHDVFSSAGTDKRLCFQMIRERYGLDCNYLVIGDGSEEQEAALAMNWAFHGVRGRADLVDLYKRHLDS